MLGCKDTEDDRGKAASHSQKIPAARPQSRATIRSRVSGPAPLAVARPKGSFSAVNRSELNHGQTGNSFEVAQVQRRYVVAEMQRCRANQQILKCKLDTHRLLLPFDAPC